MVRKQIKKIAAAFLAISLCFTIISQPCTAENTKALKNAAQEYSQQDNNGDLAYKQYYSDIKDYQSSEKNAVAELNTTISGTPLEFSINVPETGLYTAGMIYKAVDSEISDYEIDLKIDEANVFEETKGLIFPRIWKDETKSRKDDLGNEFASKQISFNDYTFCTAKDITKWTNDPYYFYLTAGIHKVTISSVSGVFDVKNFEFGAAAKLKSYKTPDNTKKYQGDRIVIEGENPYYKNSYWLSAKSDNSSAEISPNSVSKTLVNYIGGGNWKTSGQEIVWQTPELEEGYYNLGFSYRQSAVINGKTYRSLKIDGKVPFSGADAIGFEYGDNWQNSVFSDKNDKPYLIYLSKGKHEISLTCTPGEMASVRDYLSLAVANLGELYIDMTMITGEKVDIYRDYDLFVQIEDMDKRLELILDYLKDADEQLKKITGQNSGSQSSTIKSMIQVIEQMQKNKYTAHRYKGLYYDKYCAVSSVLNEMRDMPLDIDKISLFSPEENEPFQKVSLLKQIEFSVKKFFVSFYSQYDQISKNGDSANEITVWVNWGRDQAQVLNSMVQNTFSLETGINVNIKLVTASIVQAKLSNKAPDCILQQSRSEPVNLAMRGVLYNIAEFDDYQEVLKRFKAGADIPYWYNNGLYGLPDTQVFYVMYYRKDILAQLGLSVPKTWEEFNEVSKILARHNLNSWLPNKPVTDMAQANAGIGSVNIFPSILLQKDLSIYSSDGKTTTLSSPETMKAFGEWTDYYRKLKLPITLDFYNRFRTGTCPIGIEPYTLYTTLKVAAPEIDGLWGISVIPGTVKEDGTVSHISSGGGTAAAILKDTKNPKASWEFLKWWTDAETQLTFSNEIESILGPVGRVALSNVEAFNKMTWDRELITPILEAWDQVEEIPEYPGSYYVSRSLYQSFWNVVDANNNIKDMLLKYSKEANEEIARKWKQYEQRG